MYVYGLCVYIYGRVWLDRSWNLANNPRFFPFFSHAVHSRRVQFPIYFNKKKKKKTFDWPKPNYKRRDVYVLVASISYVFQVRNLENRFFFCVCGSYFEMLKILWLTGKRRSIKEKQLVTQHAEPRVKQHRITFEARARARYVNKSRSLFFFSRLKSLSIVNSI